MPFYEVIYETGSKSVAQYEDDEEMKRALKAHHNRAINGESGTPSSTPRNDLGADSQAVPGEWPAERVKRVFKYDKHPASLNLDQGLSTDEVKSLLSDAVTAVDEGGVVHVPTLAAKVRELTDPHVAEVTRHDSQYKAEGTEVDMAFLENAK